jgi:tRNA A37 threonylcarbamoyladenosine synthetase subunit TsaC/SUA5/YrdC
MELIDRGHEPPADTIADDAREAFRIMRAGGVAVLPLSVSYAIFAHTARGVERIYELKQRAQSKPNGVIGNWDIFAEVMQTTQRDKDLVRCITQDHDLPLSVIAPFHADHDWLRTVEFGGLRRSTKNGTMDLLLNALARMSWDAAAPLMGSSANLSLTGSKFELHEVQDTLKSGCDIVLGYGRSRYANAHGIGSTIIELPSWRVLRWGGCFEQQAAIILKTFGVALPARPVDGPLSLV